MKICLFGGSGGLGKQLSELMMQEKYDIVSLSSKDLDITDKKQVDNFFEKNNIDTVVNLAVYNYDCFIHFVNFIN